MACRHLSLIVFVIIQFSHLSPENVSNGFEVVRGLTVFFFGLLFISFAEHVLAAAFVLTVSDSNNATSTSFNGNAQGHWSSGPRCPGNTYSTGAFAIRSPNNATSYTFAGDSLTIAGGGGRFLMKGTGTTLATSQTCTVNLFLGGGYADEANASDGAIETSGRHDHAHNDGRARGIIG